MGFAKTICVDSHSFCLICRGKYVTLRVNKVSEMKGHPLKGKESIGAFSSARKVVLSGYRNPGVGMERDAVITHAFVQYV